MSERDSNAFENAYGPSRNPTNAVGGAFTHVLKSFVSSCRSVSRATTGSRTHPWLYAVTHFVGLGVRVRGSLKIYIVAVDIQQEDVYAPVENQQEAESVKETTSEILQGTLDLMVLKTLEGLGPLHGYGIARRIEQVSEGVLELNQGTIYPALLRLQQKGWIKAEWGSSENNRRAKYYSLTRTGRKQLATETEDWKRISAIIGRMLKST